ncbi:MAG TPA: hypothetical protein VK808_07360 [Bacteroidia bacterium]|jgi:hypothetical protein|nr:hypothetical protein [Bacteroidia bacterium]
MFPKDKTGPLVGIITISLIIAFFILFIELFIPCIYYEYLPFLEIARDIVIGLFSASVLLWLQEYIYSKRIYDYYKKIVGEYEREDIGQDNTDDTKNENLKKKNNGLKIHLKYEGNHTFSIHALYWIDNEVAGTIEFLERNGQFADGRFRYIKGNEKGTLGTYKIFRLEEDETKLLVLYQLLFPRDRANDPDKNRGWEIWKKVGEC